MSSDFITRATDDLKAMEDADRVDNEQVKTLITALKQKVIKITFEGIEIRIPASIPHEVKEMAFEMKRLRDEIERKNLRNDPDEDTEEEEKSLDQVLEPTFEMIAGICLDDPWNKKETWRYIEKQTGASDRILGKILDSITETDKKIKKFR